MQKDKQFSFFQYKKKKNIIAKTGQLSFYIYWNISKFVGVMTVGVFVMAYGVHTVDNFLHQEQREQVWKQETENRRLIDKKVDALSTAFNQELSKQLLNSASQDSVIASIEKDVEVDLVSDNSVNFRFFHQEKINSLSYRGTYLIEFTDKKLKNIYLNNPNEAVLKDFTDNNMLKVEEVKPSMQNTRDYYKHYKITKK